jgi:hypothetical protein
MMNVSYQVLVEAVEIILLWSPAMLKLSSILRLDAGVLRQDVQWFEAQNWNIYFPRGRVGPNHLMDLAAWTLGRLATMSFKMRGRLDIIL